MSDEVELLQLRALRTPSKICITSAADNNTMATAPWRGLLGAGATKKYNNMLSAIFIILSYIDTHMCT